VIRPDRANNTAQGGARTPPTAPMTSREEPTMKVADHRLHSDDGEPVAFEPTPNQGGELDPRYLVMHYTAARSAEGSIRWLTSPDARASAHLVIGRDGSITQLLPFDRVAWHAGPSRWDGLEGLNHYSIGIELCNAGRLERKGDKWCAWFGTAYSDDEIMVACHPSEDQTCGWHLYTPEQIEAALKASEAIIKAYDLLDLVGHDDISPGRKVDPGPAFPMDSFRAHLFGRDQDRPPVYETAANLNIRTGPGTGHERLSASPLPQGTRLDVVAQRGDWRQVKVLGGVGGERDIQGWVHGDFIRRAG
jgi:N-acetylmuramoyl-L-alanine amidase